MIDKGKIGDELGPIITDLRTRRKPFDEQWLLYHAAYRGKLTRQFFKSEIFAHYLPQLRRSVEKFTLRGAQMLCPSPDFFEVFPSSEETPDERSELVRAYFYYLFTKRIRIYNLCRVLLRCYAIYGRAISKTAVEIVEAVIKDKEGIDHPVKNVWPTMRAVDPFCFYVYPETQTDIDKAQLLVEDIMMPYGQYDHLSRNENLGITPIVQRELTAPVWPETWSRRLQQVPLTDPNTITAGKSQGDEERPAKLIDFVALTEVWKKVGASWNRFWIVWNVQGGPYCVREHKIDLTRPPYRMASARDLPGEHYGTGMGDDLEPLQVLTNDQLNMALEGQMTEFSPPAVIDPDLVSRPASIVFRPRAKWLMKPEGVKWLEMKSTRSAGLSGVQWTMGLMDQYAGSTPMSDGQPQRNMPRAGFAMSQMLSLSLADVKDAALMLESEILTPSMGDLYYLTMKFVPDTQKVKIPGGRGFDPSTHKIEDMYGDFEFNWVGSLQSQDTQMRAQRLVQLVGMFAKLGPLVQGDLMLEGKKMDWEYFFRRVWRDALGERGAGSFIRKMTPEEMKMMLQQMQAKANEQQQQGKGGASGNPGTVTAGRGSNVDQLMNDQANQGA